MKDLLIRIDKQDKVIGYKSKQECHVCPGLLHRAFSVFIFNSKNELLLQKRSKQKLLWPQFWSNSCCSHPKKDEDLINSAANRLTEELGFNCQLKQIGNLYYQAEFNNLGCEYEITHILTGIYDGKIKINPAEISDLRWVSFEDLKKEINKYSDRFTPWLKLIIKKYGKNYFLSTS